MAQNRANYEMDADQINWLEAYQDQDHLNYIAASMIKFGAERFKGANIIKGIHHLEAIHRHRVMGIISEATTKKELFPYIFDWVIDDIRICIFFENFLKAVLLHMGVIIHRFDRNTPKGKQLDKAQWKSPLSVSCIPDNNITTELRHTTLEMGLLLGDDYQKVIGLRKDVLEIVKVINTRRNKLHLMTEVAGELSTATINDLKLLDGFVDLALTGIQEDPR